MTLLSKRYFFFIQLLGMCLLASGMPLFIGFGGMERNIAETNLSEYWRSSYDILVRPQQSKAFLDEEGQRLIEPNFLSGQSGGITLEQYETINR